MPNFDRTGPMGRGERTGRRMGQCRDEGTENYSQGGYGYGRGRCPGRRGFGMSKGKGNRGGFGFGQQRGLETRSDLNSIQPVNTPVTTTNKDLKQALVSLKNQQNAINEAIMALEKKIAD